MQRLLVLIAVIFQLTTLAQKKSANLVYVDKQGVLRYTKDKTEAAFFGVNYTAPFAYGYRSHKALGVDIEKAIDADVYHMARHGLDAFRVHVWDVEISDSLGNLLANEHLRLFDYLVKKLKEANIKILITPIAFWGNGYPERDEKLNGFSAVYGKGPSVVKEEAIKAQENYLKQFFSHINSYTKLSYKDDPDVIATEINNEPHHSGPKEKTTEYINRLAAAIKSTGWTKPIFYNISESPTYADAVVKANVDGHSFQWYPTGLVAGHEQKGNFLPNVDEYRIPFLDTIAAFKNRARMVYEFDAADILQPIMYPAMARSFRTAGMQWATQFAYDPMATAYANTEYQTHYLNLAYTPSKAISLMIASKAFHRLPRGKSYGVYPADTLFDVFRVSYQEQLSEMNSEEEFYYSNNTSTQPKNGAKLKHIAGVGSSPVVKYEGTGAYFLDKIDGNSWMLEIMPDAITINDPFEKASLQKTVVETVSKLHLIQLLIPRFEHGYSINKINNGGSLSQNSNNNKIVIGPGVYHVVRNPEQVPIKNFHGDARFYLPVSAKSDVVIYHKNLSVVSPNRIFVVSASIINIDSIDKVSLELRNSSNKWRTVQMHRINTYDYKADVPVDMVTPSVIEYRITVRKANGETFMFPWGFKGDPLSWDGNGLESYYTIIAAPDSPLEIFNPTTDRSKIILYNPDWRSNTIEYITATKPMQLVLKATMNKPTGNQFMALQYFFSDKIAGRREELSSFTKLIIRAKSNAETGATISLITTDAAAFTTTVSLTKEWKDIEIPLSAMQKDSLLLLPRPYPGFQPLRFMSSSTKPFSIADAEKFQMSFGEGTTTTTSIEVESVWLKK